MRLRCSATGPASKFWNLSRTLSPTRRLRTNTYAHNTNVRRKEFEGRDFLGSRRRRGTGANVEREKAGHPANCQRDPCTQSEKHRVFWKRRFSRRALQRVLGGPALSGTASELLV